MHTLSKSAVQPLNAIEPSLMYRAQGTGLPLKLTAGMMAILIGTATVFVPVAMALAMVALAACSVFAALVNLRTFGLGEKSVPSMAFNRVLLWAMAINMPTFLAFDRSGLNKISMFNPQSYSRILFFFLVAALFLAGRCMQSPAATQRRDEWRWALAPVLLLFAWYALDSLLVSRGQDLLLALFRAAEWFLLLALLDVAIRDMRALGKDDMREFLGMMMPIALIPSLANLVALPLMPSLVYATSESSGVGRFGGLFTNPVVLGTLATLVIFYALTQWRGWKRGCVLAVSLAVLVATYSRGPWIGFFVAFGLYAFLATRSAATRLFILIGIALGTLGFFFGDELAQVVTSILARGGSDRGLSTLSDRTVVWTAAREMISSQPWLGWGFVAGPKRLADVMVTMNVGQYFVAPHAHNELLQAMISDGLPAGVLSALLQLRAIALCFMLRKAMAPRTHAMVAAWVTVMVLYGLLQPLLSNPVAPVGVLFVLLYIGMEIEWRRFVVVARSRRGAMTLMLPVQRRVPQL